MQTTKYNQETLEKKLQKPFKCARDTCLEEVKEKVENSNLLKNE